MAVRQGRRCRKHPLWSCLRRIHLSQFWWSTSFTSQPTSAVFVAAGLCIVGWNELLSFPDASLFVFASLVAITRIRGRVRIMIHCKYGLPICLWRNILLVWHWLLESTIVERRSVFFSSGMPVGLSCVFSPFVKSFHETLHRCILGPLKYVMAIHGVCVTAGMFRP